MSEGSSALDAVCWSTLWRRSSPCVTQFDCSGIFSSSMTVNSRLAQD